PFSHAHCSPPGYFWCRSRPRERMSQFGSTPSPFRVAVVGAGPAGFFVAERLLGQSEIPVALDLFERLPAPYGLVRFGVAPDHEKIKNVTRTFDKVAGRPGFRFFGNVEIGRDLSLDQLRRSERDRKSTRLNSSHVA